MHSKHEDKTLTNLYIMGFAIAQELQLINQDPEPPRCSPMCSVDECV